MHPGNPTEIVYPLSNLLILGTLYQTYKDSIEGQQEVCFSCFHHFLWIAKAAMASHIQKKVYYKEKHVGRYFIAPQKIKQRLYHTHFEILFLPKYLFHLRLNWKAKATQSQQQEKNH